MEPQEYIEDIDLQKYWLVLKRRWMPAIGVLSVVVGLSTLFTLMQKPIYQATGRLLVKTDRASSLAGLNVELGELKPLNYQNNPLDTQVEIIRSLPVVQEAVEKLQLIDGDGNPLDPELVLKQLQVKTVPGTDVLQIAYKSTDPEMASTVVNALMQAFLENNIQSNRAEAIAVRSFIEDQLPDSEEAVRQAEAALSQFKEQNRVIALDQEANQAVIRATTLNEQVTQTQAQLAELNVRSGELQRQIGIALDEAVNLSALSQSSSVQEALVELQRVQTQLAVERTRYQAAHPTIAALERREASLASLLQERVGEVLQQEQQVSLDNLQMGELKQRLISELVQSEIQRLGLVQRLEVLFATQARHQQRANALPSLERTQRELERQVRAAQSTYETLLNRLQEVQVAENQNIGNARIIDIARVPKEAIAPRKSMIVAAGGFAGILLAIAAAFLIDVLDQSVKTVKESKELFGYTLLGIIPAFGKTSKLVSEETLTEPRVIARDFPYSPVREAYQILQANLKFLSSDQALKTVVVTSSVPGEGKSEVAVNLAVAMSQVGRRVLLIDADMRSPSLHAAWNLTNAIGLSNVIVGQSQLDAAVRNVLPDLDILPSGVIPPNSVALLDSKRMATVIEELASHYDFIILDTPPITGFADASILGRMTDGILLVVRPGVVNAAGARAAKTSLTQSTQTVLGIVANGVDIRNEPDSYFYYTKEYSGQPDSSFRELTGTMIPNQSR